MDENNGEEQRNAEPEPDDADQDVIHEIPDDVESDDAQDEGSDADVDEPQVQDIDQIGDFVVPGEARYLPNFGRHIQLQNAVRLFRQARAHISPYFGAHPLDDTQSEDSDSESEEQSAQQGTSNMGGASSSNASDAEENKRKRRLNRMNFDRNLPTTHQYLGRDLEDLEAGQTIYEPGSIVSDVPLFPLPSLILMPGQTLPIQTLNLRAISMFRLIIEHRKIFATLHVEESRGERGELVSKFSDVGTLAQIIAYKEETEHETTTMSLKAVGRQRFKLIEKKRTIDGSQLARIFILPEISLQPFLKGAAPPSLVKFAGSFRIKTSQRRKFCASVCTPYPAFLYRHYDMKEVLDECIAELCHWYDKERVTLMAENLSEFSFWIASNMPIDDRMKIDLLSLDSPLARLMLELRLLKQGSEYCCRECNTSVCKKADMFSMSLSGPMAAYVNSHGHLHETATFLKATNVSIMTRPTSENSWFPGYAWSILNCSSCTSHLGWKFTAESRTLKPHKFWGITRASIIPRLNINLQEEGDNTRDNRNRTDSITLTAHTTYDTDSDA